MNRRGFLSGLIATAVLDPDKLLWRPGKKTIFIPPSQMPRSILTAPATIYYLQMGQMPIDDGVEKWLPMTSIDAIPCERL